MVDFDLSIVLVVVDLGSGEIDSLCLKILDIVDSVCCGGAGLANGFLSDFSLFCSKILPLLLPVVSRTVFPNISSIYFASFGSSEDLAPLEASPNSRLVATFAATLV